MTILLDQSFDALTRKIAAETGFVCPAYKPRCVQRRIAVRMRARGVHTYMDYAALLDHDPVEYERLLDALTINVTKLFRNPETFEVLGHTVIPRLWADMNGALRAWSAGCASGEEAYSLALLFAEHAERSAHPERLEHVEVLGTDIDRGSLLAAAGARYGEPSFGDMPPALRARWFGPGPGGVADPQLRSIVRFEQRDLLHETPPPGPHHLVVCRNVLIYFERDAQDALLHRMHEALVPGGYLVLGKVESIIGELRTLYEPVDLRERIYRRRS